MNLISRTRLLSLAIAIMLIACAVVIALPTFAYADTTPRTALTTANAKTTTQVKSIPMYRLYNPNTGEHLYTSQLKEKRFLSQKRGWDFEGIAWYAPEKSNTPVYRLVHKNGAHHYTISEHERKVLKKRGWKDEGIGWYSDDNETVAVHRVAKPGAALVRAHHYTTSTNERNTLVKKRKWKSEGVGWYALAEGKSIKDGWIKKNGKWTYWLEGKQLKGEARWLLTSQRPTAKSDKGVRRYRLDADGNAKTGFFILDGAKYYAIPTKIHVVHYAHHYDKTHTLVADKNGKLYNGGRGFKWSTAYTPDKSKQRFFFEPTKDGKAMAARVGFFDKDGNKYYGYPTQGFVARSDDNLLLENKYFFANNEGHLREGNAVVAKMYRKAQGYSSPSKYLLMVDIDDCYTVVFQGKQGAWKIKYIWRCCTGRPTEPTPIGNFKVLWKKHNFGEEHGYSCYYWTGFTTLGPNYGFHSRIYYPYTHSPRYFKDGRLGERVSAGCVRLSDANAIWVQKNCPKGTTVITMA